ncbi:MAG TPA: translation elongation factor G, partial [Ruminococcaceae bacterium]|nr:translation elongation factor G [Oscillospiraceae bacterium]
TVMDTHTLEKERGITIFAGQTTVEYGGLEMTLLDTPGHVDFSAETERMLRVLDYAVLVISGTEPIQSHTVTLWKLLKEYHIPTFLFVTKMDYSRLTKAEILERLRNELKEEILDFTEESKDTVFEAAATCREELLDKYLNDGALSNGDLAELIAHRQIFPCYFGSGLKMDGIEEFLQGLEDYTLPKKYPTSFGAKVFKITHDANGAKLTHLKVTGGALRVRDSIAYLDKEEKISGIRLYSGARYVCVDEVQSGSICVITGLTATVNGMGLGYEEADGAMFTQPLMNYRIRLPQGTDAQSFLPKLKRIEEEDPQLQVSWNSHLQEIHVGLMGDIQAEILTSMIEERFGITVTIDSGRVLYKESVEDTVEGIGHYEPLRHYAEVHLILEPLPRGSGLVFRSKCSEDVLDRNWQRLILEHMQEKQHLGVLTGSPITDMKITLAAGRAHLKHTEGGDFRQSTYRAIRQGLMQAKSVLLEPYYRFRLEIPSEFIGRAITDLRMRHGTVSQPEDANGYMVLTGRVPVVTVNRYAGEVSAYSGGRGRIFFTFDGYDNCHNPDEVINEYAYQPEADLDNTPDSVFCSHGAGFVVKWDKVTDYMHIDSCLSKQHQTVEPVLNQRNFHIDDKELEAIMTREFGPAKQTSNIYRPTPKPIQEKQASQPTENPRKKYLIIDGYNVIFAWSDLKKLAQTDLDLARETLIHVLSNYKAFTQTELVLVFDAYRVAGNAGSRQDHNNIHVVYTKEHETGDAYIEKLVADIGKNYNVRVVTSDNLIQLSAVRFGVLRVSANEFEREVESVHERIAEYIQKMSFQKKTTIGEGAKRKNK